MRSINKPLTDEDFAKIRRGRQRAEKLRELFDKMERCGVDCTENAETLASLDSFLERLEKEFFADGVPR